MSVSTQPFYSHICSELEGIEATGLAKRERPFNGVQGAVVHGASGAPFVNLCANNYLGLSSHPHVVASAQSALARYGAGLSSVRFICGTLDLHCELERKISNVLGTEDTILYPAAFDANGGLFEPLFGEPDAIISDELNHASIIDGIRLCKARRFRYKHADLSSLEDALRDARQAGARFVIVFTDGVFSMDGTIADLRGMRELCDRYGALLGIDECHATGVLGHSGRGTHQHWDLVGKIDLITGTLGKALGGASGGFTSGRREVIALLRQRSRPYLFSNALPPAVLDAAMGALDILQTSTALRDKLFANTAHFRHAMSAAGFSVKPGNHPIVPVLIPNGRTANALARRLYELGVFVVAFTHPVVPMNLARIRVQLSAAHDTAHLDHALRAFVQAGSELRLL